MQIEFSQATVYIIYVLPSANADVTRDIIHMSIVRLQTHHPSIYNYCISGDFNHASLLKSTNL